jgi:non-homologous end joining protein Ku
MEDDYFDDIPDEKIPKDMLDLASQRFDSDKFEDQYDDALKGGSSRDG